MATTPLLLLVFDKIVARKINTTSVKTGPSPKDEGRNVLVLGFGRVGQMAARLLRTQNIKSTLIDFDADHIEFTAPPDDGPTAATSSGSVYTESEQPPAEQEN